MNARVSRPHEAVRYVQLPLKDTDYGEPSLMLAAPASDLGAQAR